MNMCEILLRDHDVASIAQLCRTLAEKLGSDEDLHQDVLAFYQQLHCMVGEDLACYKDDSRNVQLTDDEITSERLLLYYIAQLERNVSVP